MKLPISCALVLTTLAPTFAGSPTAVSVPPPTVSSTEGFYLELYGGASGLTQDGFSLGGKSGSADYSVGWLAGGAVGHQWSNLGVELEWFYRTNELDELSLGGVKANDGDLSSTNLFLNLTWQLDGFGAPGARWLPYFGAGFGLLEEVDIDATKLGVEDFSDEWVPAGQVLLGVRKELSEHWSLFAEGRYIFAGEVDLTAEKGGGDIATLDYDGWSALVGVRFTF
jgi:opacity protein-like surface antigen